MNDNRTAVPKLGDRAICFCDEEIVYTGQYWDHVGINKPRHIAIPKDDMPDNPAWSNGVVLKYHDAPEDEAEDNRILVESGILPKLIDAATNTLRRPEGMTWEQELAAIGEDEPETPTIDPPHLTKGVRNVYDVLLEALAPGQKILLQTLWELACADSRMLDWLETKFEHHKNETNAQFSFSILTILDVLQQTPRTLREAIQERMGTADAQ